MSKVLNVLKNENMMGAITRFEDTISQCKNRMGGYGHRYLLKQDKASGASSGHILLSEELNKQTKKALVSELRSLCFLS